MRILHVTPHLNYSGAAGQLALLCHGLKRTAFDVHVAVLTKHAVLAPALGAAAIPVHPLGTGRRLDLACLWRLRGLIHSLRPDLIHAWGPAAARLAALASVRSKVRSLVGHPFAGRPGGKLRLLDRWLLGRQDRVLARGQAEAERCRQLGVPEERIETVLPGVAFPSQAASLLHHSGPVILCAGAFEPHKGYRDALWALDILRYLYPDLCLVLAGAGPERARLDHFTRRNRLRDNVRFLDPQPDLSGLLQRADLVWIPSLTDTGMHLALEAMAAGKPVVASRFPLLQEIVVDGETGYFFPSQDKETLARRTHQLLGDAALRQRLGQAGRRRAQSHFSAAAFLDRNVALYAKLAG
jgi:glycosyltransferase involved in cell wall biosynthesis